MSTGPQPVDMAQVPPVPWASVGDPAIVLEIHEWKVEVYRARAGVPRRERGGGLTT